jgi:predicted ester cyclase
MSKLIESLARILSLGAIIGFFLSYPLLAGAETAAEVAANKAVVARILEVKGTPDYRVVARDVFSPDHKVLRAEFENLVYNADDPLLQGMADRDSVAITDRTNTIVQLMGEGDRVAARLQITGTHSGNLYGIPATGKAIDIALGAIFRLENGKIVESWYMAEEARLLRQLGARLPARQDGKINLAPVYHDTRTFNEGLQELMAHPVDTPEYRHKRLMLSYKAKDKPADYMSWAMGQHGRTTGRPYGNLVRGGIDNIVERGAELGVEGSHGRSMSEREDMIGTVISEGDQAMFAFRLTSINSGPLYGIPPSGNELHDWELGFAEFEGDKWTNAWYMADELAFLLTIGNEEAVNFLVSD